MIKVSFIYKGTLMQISYIFVLFHIFIPKDNQEH